jgi:hypothetical protein
LAATQSLTAAVDQVIAFFNARRMDLPDGLFERKTQFVINGAPFETLLGQSPNDPLILMLSRGPAGYRFTVTGVHHAVQNAHIDRGDIISDGDPFKVQTQLWLSGQLRNSGEPLNVMIAVTLKLTSSGSIEIAAATIEEAALEKIRQARRS